MLKGFIQKLYDFNPDPDSVFSKEFVIREFFFHPHTVRLQDIISFTLEMVSDACLYNSSSVGRRMLQEYAKKFTTIFYRELQNGESFILNAGFSNSGSSFQNSNQDIHHVFPLQNDFFQLLLHEKKDLYEFNPSNHGWIPTRPLKYLDHYPEYPFIVVPQNSKIYVFLPEQISFKNREPISAVGTYAFLTVKMEMDPMNIKSSNLIDEGEEGEILNVKYIVPENNQIKYPKAKLLDKEIFLPLLPVIGNNDNFQKGSITAWQNEITRLAKDNFCTIPFDQSISINGMGENGQLNLSLKN